MNKSEKKIYFLFILISLIFLILTTNYLTLSGIINDANQMDVISYSEIAEKAPLFNNQSDIIIKHVAQRFLIPYTVGSLAKLLNIDFYLMFKIFTFGFIFFYIGIIKFICEKLNFNLKTSILFFSILFFNPYLIRYHIFNPVQAHDMLFFCLGLIFAVTLIYKNYISNLIATVFSVYLRQTSIAFLIGSILFFLINRKLNLLFILIILFFSSFLLIINIGNYISIHNFPIKLAYGIIFYDFSQLEKLIKFLLLGAMPFFPLLIIIFGKINSNTNLSILFILLFVCLMMIGQPILGGPDGSVNNVGRIANLSYPVLTVLIFYFWNFNKFVENSYLFYSFIFGLFIWSLHPTFSIFKLFGILRFYNF